MAGTFELPERRKAWCNQCHSETHHSKRHVVFRQSEPGEFPAWVRVHELLERNGCDSIGLRIRSMNEEELVDDGEGHGVPDIREQYFPPMVSRPRPNWLGSLEWPIEDVMNEVYQALDGNLRSLAGMGARTVLDRVMTDKVGASGSFVARLDRMVSQHFITEDQKTFLDAALELGHAANHRGHRPSASQLATALDIVEYLLQTLYVLPEQVAQLRWRIPPRN